VPYDDKSALVTSGIRIGTAAVTSRGMKEDAMDVIADLIDKVVLSPTDEKILNSTKEDVKALTSKYPLYA
jgi:glycine hydroxymethyltransferase